MMFSNGLLGGDELHTHLLGALGELSQYPLAVAFLVVVLALVGVLERILIRPLTTGSAD